MNTYPSVALGAHVGNAMGSNANDLGVPRDCTLWLDLEWGEVSTPSAVDTLAYAEEWGRQVVEKWGYHAGIYHGPNSGVTGEQLYNLRYFRHYWKAMSQVRGWVTGRHYQLFQGYTQKIHGLEIDPDMAVFDNQNDRFRIVAPKAA
jgi:hypothetical protein